MAIQLVTLLCVAALASGFSLLDFDQREPPVPEDPCYDAKLKRPRACVPDFVNAAYGVSVEASSTCGSPAKQFCDSTKNDDCHVCDTRENAHPPQFLTDLHNPNNETCWQSDFLEGPNDNVSLTISLRKKYELTYVSLHFCHAKPHSMAILKSMDHGKTWQPFQYYSADCRAVFDRDLRVPVTRANEQEPLCIDSHLSEDEGNVGTRIAFSTLADRPSAEDFENSPVLQDWVTATDIRIVFPAVAKSEPKKKSVTVRLEDKTEFPRLDLIRSRKLVSLSNSNSKNLTFDEEEEHLEEDIYDEEEEEDYDDDLFTTQKSILKEEDDDDYEDDIKTELQWVGVSDLAIGGRCKCNGHASECTLDRNGEMACTCKHNTAGRECEKCKSFHFDRPWGRATSTSVNECVACKCNNHARRCRFNMELYQLSGGVSGGVCLKCRHNTAGRHCHYCKEGYYRNAKKPITHHKACEPCDCHPVGASGKICNQTSGQCPCKDGVTGRECNRCAKGYQQSGSPIAPCIKVPRPVKNSKGKSDANGGYGGYRGQAADECADCQNTSKRVQMRKYCAMDYVYLVTVLGKEKSDERWTRFRVEVDKRYKSPPRGASKFRRGQSTYLWVRTKHLRCRCPKIRPNTSYLVLDEVSKDADEDYRGKEGLTISRKTLVIEWKKEWRRRMKRFKRRSRKYCRQ